MVGERQDPIESVVELQLGKGHPCSDPEDAEGGTLECPEGRAVMKNRVFKLVREAWDDDDCMLRTPHVPYTPERIDFGLYFGLCNHELEAYFDVPKDCEKAWLVLSTEEHEDSYGVLQVGNDYLRVEDPDESVWVDDDLAHAIALFIKAAKQDVVYLSIELPL